MRSNQSSPSLLCLSHSCLFNPVVFLRIQASSEVFFNSSCHPHPPLLQRTFLAVFFRYKSQSSLFSALPDSSTVQPFPLIDHLPQLSLLGLSPLLWAVCPSLSHHSVVFPLAITPAFVTAPVISPPHSCIHNATSVPFIPSRLLCATPPLLSSLTL